MTRPVLRFAPSPNGRLHLGHAHSALLNEAIAARLGGRFLLRIEDIDTTRCRPDFIEGIEQDLAWLGLDWERPVRRQSEHFDDYAAASSSLHQRSLVYPCFCSRKDIAGGIHAAPGSLPSRDPDGVPLYPGTCRHLALAKRAERLAKADSHTWRIDMNAALAARPDALAYPRMDLYGMIESRPADPSRWGDAVLVRRDIPTSYHLSVVVDDARQGVTHVVRGEDLEAATDFHVLLQHLLGLPTPIYHHHPLIRDQAGDKLAKSRFSETLADLRERGLTPSEIRKSLGARESADTQNGQPEQC